MSPGRAGPQVCPRCACGPVVDRVVVATGERWWVCQECEAVWHLLQTPRAPGFEDLTLQLAARGRGGSWSELREPGPGDLDPLDDLDHQIDLTEDPDPEVRERAVRAVAPAATSHGTAGRLILLLEDPEPAVATAAAAGLLRYGDPAAADAVVLHGAGGATPDAVDLGRALAEALSGAYFTAHRLAAHVADGSGPPWPQDAVTALHEASGPR